MFNQLVRCWSLCGHHVVDEPNEEMNDLLQQTEAPASNTRSQIPILVCPVGNYSKDSPKWCHMPASLAKQIGWTTPVHQKNLPNKYCLLRSLKEIK